LRVAPNLHACTVPYPEHRLGYFLFRKLP
jgi:hypothetical protein